MIELMPINEKDVNFLKDWEKEVLDVGTVAVYLYLQHFMNVYIPCLYIYYIHRICANFIVLLMYIVGLLVSTVSAIPGSYSYGSAWITRICP